MESKIKKLYVKVIRVDDFYYVNYDFVKIFIYDEKGCCSGFKFYFYEFFDKVYIVVFEDVWIDIVDIGVYKGYIVEILQNLLNVNKDEIMVFGDGLNDIELMERVIFSFVMCNVFEEIKFVVNFIIGRNIESVVMLII